MSRYIEYHDICSAISNQQDGTGMTYEALAHAMVEIQLAPSIDLVTCAECRWSRPRTLKGETGYRCLFYRVDKAEDGYCDNGEREDERCLKGT